MIYRKTIDVGYITGTSPKVISHGIIDIDNIIKFEGFAKLDSGYTMNIPHVSTTEVQGVNIGANKTEIRLYHNYDNIDQYYAYVTIYYTKV